MANSKKKKSAAKKAGHTKAIAATSKPSKQVVPPKKTAAADTSLPSVERTQRGWWYFLAKYLGLPLLIYFVFFCLFTGSWIGHFNSQLFTDGGDGLQNVWNIWWINHSVVDLHQLPWHTTFLHYPYGTTLLGQTLNPFNGFMAIPLLQFLSLVQTFNLIMIFSFVVGGLTMFWLCHYFTRNWIASLIGGFAFTFSSYHFAHALGHMQLVSLEWIPLFVLLWWRLLTKPRYRLAIGAAVTLMLVLWCDYYYFLYSLATAVAIFFYLRHKKELAPWNKPTKMRWGLFALLAAVIVLPLPLALLRTNAHDPLLGSHPSRIFSTDLLTPFLDGGFWRFAWLTNWYWHNIKAFAAESSVYITWAILALVGIGLFKRRKIHRDIVFWSVLGLVFAVFSLGPRLMVVGYSINHAPMPYVILERIIPGLKLSGVPVRMMAMTIFATSIIAALVLARLSLKDRKGKILLAVFAVVLCFEVWPAKLPLTPLPHAPYLQTLKHLPATGGVLDNAAASEAWQLYDQTVYEKPMALGYISRTPTSVANKDAYLVAAATREQYDQLCSVYKIRYITTPARRPLHTTLPVIYRDNQTLIYDIKTSPNC